MINRPTALVFIDWENLRQSIVRNFAERVSPSQVIDALREIATEVGIDFRGGNFYGDWTRRGTEDREIHNHGLAPVHVVSTRAGRDRSDPRMILDMYDTIRERGDIDCLIVGSGDSDFAEVIRRGKEHGKRMYVCAIGISTARELFTLSDGVFALEARLRLTKKAPQLPLPFGMTGTIDWRPLVSTLASLEAKLPYVVRNYLANRILSPSMGYGETDEEKIAFLRKAVDEGIITEYELPNPRIPNKTVMACRLNRKNETVTQILAHI